MSTFSGISSALSALGAHRKAMDVAGQNIANVNTPGYTRQRAELQEVPGLKGAPLSVGVGVEVVKISRAYDELASQQVNTRSADHALLSGRSATLTNLESISNEPGENGLASVLNKMWLSWSAASTAVGTTGEAAARTVVIGATQTVADTLRNSYAEVEQLWSSTAAKAQAGVLEVNTAAADVAALNELIQKSVTTGGGVNELMDQRDQLVTRIVELTGATTEPGPNGQVNVFLGGTPLVQGRETQQLRLSTPSSMNELRAGGTVAVVLGNETAPLPSGQLAADVEALRTTLPGAAAQYDAIATSVVNAVNTGQANGVDYSRGTGTPPVHPAGLALLQGTATTTAGVTTWTAKASGLTLAQGVGPADLALGGAGMGRNDGSNAKAMAAMGTTPGGPDAKWSSYVADLGARGASAAQRSTAAQQLLTSAVKTQQGSAGVSLDEETANLIASQRAYQGAARVLTAVDEMLDTLINRTGLVGR